MQKVREHVKFVDFIQAFNAFILRLSADCVPLQHSNIEVTSHDDPTEMRHRHCYRTCTHEWIIDEISCCDLRLIRHQEGQLVICRRRTKIRSLFKVISCVESLMILAFSTLFTLFVCGDLQSEIGHTVTAVLDHPEDKLWVVQADVFFAEIKGFKKLYYRYLLLHANFAANTLEAELEFLSLGDMGCQTRRISILDQELIVQSQGVSTIRRLLCL